MQLPHDPYIRGASHSFAPLLDENKYLKRVHKFFHHNMQ